MCQYGSTGHHYIFVCVCVYYRLVHQVVCVRVCVLDEVLEGVSVGPLLCERGSVSHGGEVTQTETVLHALISTRHLLLFGLHTHTHSGLFDYTHTHSGLFEYTHTHTLRTLQLHTHIHSGLFDYTDTHALRTLRLHRHTCTQD